MERLISENQLREWKDGGVVEAGKSVCRVPDVNMCHFSRVLPTEHAHKKYKTGVGDRRLVNRDIVGHKLKKWTWLSVRSHLQMLLYQLNSILYWIWLLQLPRVIHYT